MNDQDRIEMAAENCEVLRARLAKYEDAEGRPVSTLAEQAREIERLRLNIAEYNEHERCYQSELAALKAQPSGVVQWPDADEIMQMAFEEGQPSEDASGYYFELEEFDLFIQRLMEEVARLNSSPVSSAPSHGELAVLREYRTAIRNFNDCHGVETDTLDEAVEIERKAEARLEAAEKACHDFYAGRNPEPSHSEQVREGWQLVPVEPTDAMLEAGDKYIGTPATYKSMLSACPSPAITKDFSQFLSAVMDAAGLIRHGRQSKELSEYLGMKCMEYRGAAPSAGSQEEQK